MDKYNQLHNEAMELVEKAFQIKQEGNSILSKDFFEKALTKECEAAHYFIDKFDCEPTRSVLYRSAASIAIDCNKNREAEKLISTALAGEPPDEIAIELRDLLDKVNFSRHLELRGIQLHPDELQFSLSGRGIGPGIADSRHFISRVKEFENLVTRTVERILGRPYRATGRQPKSISENYNLYLSVPRTGSFSVTLKLSESSQLSLPGTSSAELVIDTILKSLQFFNENDQKKLREQIPEDNYFNHFINTARNIAPDGEFINHVGFTVLRGGKEKKISIDRVSDLFEISLNSELQEISKSEKITIEGILKFADSTHEDCKIKLIDSKNKSHTIRIKR